MDGDGSGDWTLMWGRVRGIGGGSVGDGRYFMACSLTNLPIKISTGSIYTNQTKHEIEIKENKEIISFHHQSSLFFIESPFMYVQ